MNFNSLGRATIVGTNQIGSIVGQNTGTASRSLRSRGTTFKTCKRHYAGQAAAKADDNSSTPAADLRRPPRQQFGHTAQQKEADRQFFVDLLSSAAPKRDAKNFISRLTTPQPSTTTTKPTKSPDSRVNLGGLFGRARAVDQSPVFTQYEDKERMIEEQITLHVALVKISGLSQITEEVLNGIAQTLSQLARLGMAPCVVIEEPSLRDGHEWRRTTVEQADRLVTAIERIHENGARKVDNVLTYGRDGRPRVFFRRMLLRPIRKGRIPIIVPLAYSEESHTAVTISADEAMLALVKEFAGLNLRLNPDRNPEEAAAEHELLRNQISLERVIVIDESGGIPSTKSSDRTHIFVNMEQEYHSLQEELRSSNNRKVSLKHASNLKMLRGALKMLPTSASGLITTPHDAANHGRSEDDTSPSGVGTRRQKNPLIHNLLTDKPAYSSSLPSGRFSTSLHAPVSATTFVKHGMPISMFPDPAAQAWTPEKQPWVKLTDPTIDLDRLVYLVNDSFNRKLDVEAYLKRVNDRIAGVIIAGEYEGGAILTWETPPGVSPDDRSRLVPYLDKFAVLKKSQGAGGVADILFNAMVRTGFPNGVCWRSRKNNPVNKWYFERSRGTWKIPDMNWTMFWTTPNVSVLGQDDNRQTFSDYEAVCRGVQPTWADDKKILD